MKTQDNQQPEEKPHGSKWGKRRKALAAALLVIYAAMGWMRLNASLEYRNYLLELNLFPPPIYSAVTGGLIGLLFTLAFILLIFSVKAAPLLVRYLGILFLIWFWSDRIWFSTREAFFSQLFISLMITFATLVWSFILIQKKDFPRKQAAQEDNGQQAGTGS